MATSFTVNQADLAFMLKQIKLAESTSAAYTSTPRSILQAIMATYGVSAADAALLPFGLRTWMEVSTTCSPADHRPVPPIRCCRV